MNNKHFLNIIFPILLFIAINDLRKAILNFRDASPTVSINLGKIRGKYLTMYSGEPLYMFCGIRYAQAPVHELRFMPPIPVNRWNGTFDATIDSPKCPQPVESAAMISEDCLRLNVYSKNISKSALKSVIVFIHSGNFYEGSGRSDQFGPQYMMRRDIVLVTMNYRLGVLGFLSTGTPEAPGNNGLKDQVVALRWVKSNIQSFGGDPNSITLMGHGAGGMSVTLHMVSPMSRGLFHKVIALSGAATAHWKLPENQIDLAEKQAHVLNCPFYTSELILHCLKQRNSADIGNSMTMMFEYGIGNPIIMWKPVIESDFGQERFLVEDPTESFRKGNFAKVPIIAGTTQYELLHSAIALIRNETLRNEMNVNFEKWAPICFLYERNSEKSKKVSKHLKKQYHLHGNIEDERTLLKLNHLFSDAIIGFGVRRFVELASVYTNVFYYRFSYVGRHSHIYFPSVKPFGAVHNDELLYLFINPSKAPMYTDFDSEYSIVERMTRFVEKFAHDGNPNSPNDKYLQNIIWSPMHSDQYNYLDIGANPTMNDHLNTDRYAIWNRLFPLNGEEPHRKTEEDEIF